MSIAARTAVFALTALGLGAAASPAAAAPARFYADRPCRAVDTRQPNSHFGGPALAAGATRIFALAGSCSTARTAVALAVNVTVAQPTAAGHLRMYPAGSPLTEASTISFAAGKNRANNAIVATGTDGRVAVYNGQATGTVHLVIDVVGYFDDPANTPPLISNWQEHWFEHNLLVTRVAFDDHAAIFFDDDVDRAQAPWLLDYLSRQWQYFKYTYGSFGPDRRIYSIHHQGRFFGGHPGDRFSTLHDFRNSSDIGVGSWVESGGNHDIASHEVCHVVESTNNSVHGSPAFGVWGDSKWAEFCQYDLYVALGMTADVNRVFTQFTNTRDSFPRANTAWFRDWFYPLWRDRGRAQVMVRFFGLLAQHFPKNAQDHGQGLHQHYTRGMNLGEFVHFMSGAASANLLNQARTAFGVNTNDWETQLNQARITFPQITYP